MSYLSSFSINGSTVPEPQSLKLKFLRVKPISLPDFKYVYEPERPYAEFATPKFTLAGSKFGLFKVNKPSIAGKSKSIIK